MENLLHRKVVFQHSEQFACHGFFITSLKKKVYIFFDINFWLKKPEFLKKCIGAQYGVFANVEILYSIMFSH